MVDTADRVVSNPGDPPFSIDHSDSAIVDVTEQFRCTRRDARGSRARSRRRNPRGPISQASGQQGARRAPNIDDATGLRQLRSEQHADDECVPGWTDFGYDWLGFPQRGAMQTRCCAPYRTDVRRGTAERRASGVKRRRVENQPMSKICKAGATVAQTATVLLLWAVTAGLPATAEARQVCTPDVFRLCSAFIPDPNRIVVCLQQNLSNLSPACRLVMNGSGQHQ
jgi:hypothetical protein